MNLGTIMTMDEAAERLRISRRSLQELVRDHPHYAANGRKKLFSEGDISNNLLDLVHSIGKGEVESSILSRSTINIMKNQDNLFSAPSGGRAISAQFGRTKRDPAPDGVQNPCIRSPLDEIALACLNAAADVGLDAICEMSWFGRSRAAGAVDTRGAA